MFKDLIPISNEKKIHSILLQDKNKEIPFIVWASLESKKALLNIKLTQVRLEAGEILLTFTIDESFNEIKNKETLYFFQQDEGHLFKSMHVHISNTQVECKVDQSKFYIREKREKRRFEFNKINVQLTIRPKVVAKKIKVNLHDISDEGLSFFTTHDFHWAIGNQYNILEIQSIKLPRPIEAEVSHVSKFTDQGPQKALDPSQKVSIQEKVSSQFHVGLTFHEKSSIITEVMKVFFER